MITKELLLWMRGKVWTA